MRSRSEVREAAANRGERRADDDDDDDEHYDRKGHGENDGMTRRERDHMEASSSNQQPRQPRRASGMTTQAYWHQFHTEDRRKTRTWEGRLLQKFCF